MPPGQFSTNDTYSVHQARLLLGETEQRSHQVSFFCEKSNIVKVINSQSGVKQELGIDGILGFPILLKDRIKDDCLQPVREDNPTWSGVAGFGFEQEMGFRGEHVLCILWG